MVDDRRATMIEVKDLSKVYRTLEGKSGFKGAITNLFSQNYRYVEAVKDINFSVGKGEMLGLIGPNGAGKSTTIKMLTGILVPTSGQVLVDGIEPYKNRKENARNVSVVFGQRTKLWWDLPCMESFELHRVMYKIPDKIYNENLDEFMEFLELADFWKRPVRQLSLGQRMRAEIAVSLLHNPDVIYLDEPTIGMDAVAKERIRQFLKNVNETRKTTLLITSHDMVDIEKLCSRVIIIDKGSVIYEGNFNEIREKYGKERTLIVDFRHEYNDLQLPFGKVTKSEGLKKSITFMREQGTAIDLITTLGKRYEITDVSVQEAEIESVIREIYEHGVGEMVG